MSASWARSRTLRRIAGALISSVLLVGFPSGASPTVFRSSGKTLQRWSAAWMGSKDFFTQDEAVTMAQAFDIIAGHPSMFKDNIAAMRAANPNLILLAYVNGTWAPAGKYPEDWYAVDKDGNKIKWIPFNTYLLKPTEQWRQQVTTNCRLAVAPGYDGCLLDNLGVSAVSTLADKSGAAINPATNAPYTRSEWMKETALIGSYVRDHSPDLIASGNGGGRGPVYFSKDGGSIALATALDAVMIEQFMRSPTDGPKAFQAEGSWKKDVDMIVDMQHRNSRAMAITKVWTTATQAQRDQWHKFSLASFMLATDGKSYFQFLNDDGPAASTADHPWDHDLLGQPLAAYTHNADLTYRRAFTNGMAIVNPTKSTTINVDLGATYRTSDGKSVTSLTMAPHTGELLRKAEVLGVKIPRKKGSGVPIALIVGFGVLVLAAIAGGARARKRGAAATPLG